MKVKTRFIILFSFIAGFMTLLLFGMIALFQNQNTLHESQLNRHYSYKLGDALRQSDDYLTEYCKNFILTGDSIWETKYWEIYNLREGRVPTGSDWQISLSDSMHRLGFAQEEFNLLNQALKKSNELVYIERMAFNAAKGIFIDSAGNYTIQAKPDKDFALNKLLDDQYLKAKKEIMEPIAKFEGLINNRTKSATEKYEQRGEILLRIIIVAIIITIIFSIMAYVIIRHRLIQENIITNQLGERVKEQACLHKVSLLTENTKNNLEHVLDGTVRAIPFGWQYPDITCSRITFKEKCFKSIAFIESEWKQEHELIIKGEVIGKIEVFYKKEKPNANIGPFLSEEKILLDSIGSLIISYYERKLNEDNLIEINNNLRAEIAEKLKTEKDLKASEERFQLAVKGSNAGIWDLDVEKGSAYWSNIHYSLLGYELDEVTPTLDFLRNKVHTEDLSIFDKSFKNHIEGGSSLDFEARYYKKNGEQRWFRSTGASARDKDGRATRIIGTFSDITEIKTWQQSLIDKEQQLRYALDVSNEGIWEWISGEEQINYSNRCYSIAGYIFEEIQTGIDDFWKHIIHKDDSQQLSVLLV